MAKRKFKWRVASSISKEKAQKYGEHIQSLIDQNGGKLKTTEVLEDAKKTNSPTHDFFEWDDTKASKQYRLHQARILMSHIVEVVIVDQQKYSTRSFFNVRDKTSKETAYVTVKSATTNRDYRNELVNDIIKQMENSTTLLKMFRGYNNH